MNRLAIALAGAALLLVSLAQAQAPPAAPRTSDGRPDLEGFWYFGTATPLERPSQFAGKAFLTAEEAEVFERQTAERIGRTVAVHAPGWLDYGTDVVPDRRTSLIIDPPDGRVPPLTAEARQRAAARRTQDQDEAADGPEARSVQERCLVFGAGPPLVPGPYNNNLQIVQTADAVVIFTEMIHDARIVPLDGRPQLPPSVRRWLGSSRGHWEGDTLVVETSNFTDQTSFRGSDEHLLVVERFTLEGSGALRYEYTIDDPTAFTRPWTAAFTMTRTEERMYEFACHEANYGLLNILSEARAGERAADQPR